MLHFPLLYIPFAVAGGWYVGWQSSRRRPTKASYKIPNNYFRGINFLINDETDKAVDVFIKMLEVDSDTVETHLALGNLFRRRGEVDRAIRIHQNLIARPQLDKTQRVQALLELGQDYMKAGVLDRAERLFHELVSMNEHVASSLKYLLQIYEQQKEWVQAIETADRLKKNGDINIRSAIAHYYTELAEIEKTANAFDQAQRLLKQAINVDHQCVRASIMLARIKMARDDFKGAIKSFKQVREQNPDFLSEIVVDLSTCYERMGDKKKLMTYLNDCLTDFPRISLVLEIATLIQTEKGDRAAIDFIADQIHKHPSLRGLSHLLNVYLCNATGDTRDKLLILRELVLKLLDEKPVYRCSDCGVGSKTLYWQCPGCRHWSSVKPIHGLEGD